MPMSLVLIRGLHNRFLYDFLLYGDFAWQEFRSQLVAELQD
jgi:hypothetical protein